MGKNEPQRGDKLVESKEEESGLKPIQKDILLTPALRPGLIIHTDFWALALNTNYELSN